MAQPRSVVGNIYAILWTISKSCLLVFYNFGLSFRAARHEHALLLRFPVLAGSGNYSEAKKIVLS